MGSFSSNTFVASTTASCIFLAAFYSLWLATRVNFGAPSNYIQSFNDIELRELISQLCLIIPVYFFGLYPQPLCSIILPTLNYCFIHWAIVEARIHLNRSPIGMWRLIFSILCFLLVVDIDVDYRWQSPIIRWNHQLFLISICFFDGFISVTSYNLRSQVQIQINVQFQISFRLGILMDSVSLFRIESPIPVPDLLIDFSFRFSVTVPDSDIHGRFELFHWISRTSLLDCGDWQWKD